MVGIAALVEEVGRHALPSPLVATLCATFALRAARTPAADAWLARIADGAAASLAITDARGSWEPDDTRRRGARATATGLVLSAAPRTSCRMPSRPMRSSSRRARDGGLALCAVRADDAAASRSSRTTSTT